MGKGEEARLLGIDMRKDEKIYVAGHSGLVGSAIVRRLKSSGFNNLVLYSHEELDLINQQDVTDFFNKEKPAYIFFAAGRVGGINANDNLRGQFIYENLMIQNNIIHAAHETNVKKLLFLGSACIYPRNANQPMKEEYLLTDALEPTNEPYAIAKITGIKLCESYFRQYGDNFISVMPNNFILRSNLFAISISLSSIFSIPLIKHLFLEILLLNDKADKILIFDKTSLPSRSNLGFVSAKPKICALLKTFWKEF